MDRKRRVVRVFVAAMCLARVSAVVGAVSGCSSAKVAPETGTRGIACEKSFDSAKVQRQVRASVVRVVAGDASGSGFLIDSSDQGMEFATNYHVIAEGEDFKLVLPGEHGDVTISNVEVVAVDAKNDLAILHAPPLASGTQALPLNIAGVAGGQQVAAMGYPMVDGSGADTQTFETGEITAAARKVGERQFIQTSVNLNPGNSGGPLLDACGGVVGVVAAVSATAQGVALAIPAENLERMRVAHQADAEPADASIRRQLKTLEQGLVYNHPDESAAVFSRQYMREHVLPLFEKSIQSVAVKERAVAEVYQAKTGQPWAAVSLSDRMELLAKFGGASESELHAWAVAHLTNNGAFGAYEGMAKYFAGVLSEAFGDVTALSVDDIKSEGGDSGRALVSISSGPSPSRWEFKMKREWGDWRVENMSCVRGC